jgi:hypothetical protein
LVAELAAWALEQHPVDAVIAAGLREAEELTQQHALHPPPSNHFGELPMGTGHRPRPSRHSTP